MDKNSRISIIDAGVFGLSTALHLAERGYTNVVIFDRRAYDQKGYAGADAASADENKVIRASYGGRKLYQDLAFKAMGVWREWSLRGAAAKEGGRAGKGDEGGGWFFDQCGLLRLSSGGLEAAEVRTQASLPGEVREETQFRISDPERRAVAEGLGVPGGKMDPFARLARGLSVDGYLDTTAGYALASRACAFALRLCREAGVGMNLGEGCGMKELVREGSVVKGIVTDDGRTHAADLVIVACGGWTPSLLPEIEELVETTAGSVLSFRLPQDRNDLWTKFAPERFPVWCWHMSSYDRESIPLGGIFGFPRTPEGVVKICFTGAQWTDYTHRSQRSGKPVSFPKTDGEEIPVDAMEALQAFCSENLPELLDLEPETVRLCWYSDSVDGSFLVDYVPGTQGLMVCNGGSGHGFKFLPVLGEHVVDVVEGKETEYTRLFSWRGVPEGEKNGLEEGPEGWRTLGKQRMVGKSAWREGSEMGCAEL